MSALLPTVYSTTGLIGGFKTAQATKNRPLGGAVLVAAGAAAFFGWKKNRGARTAAALTTTYFLAFGVSHPLAKKIGAWPAVFSLTGAVAIISLACGRKRK